MASDILTEDPHKTLARALRAKEITSDTIFAEASVHIDKELWRLFTECAATDTEALAQIKGMQYMHSKYLAYLKRCIEAEKFARMDIERGPRHTAKEFGY